MDADTIKKIDELKENQHIAARAVPMLAGLVTSPETWEQVAPLLGDALTYGKSRKIRGDAWTRTAWAVLAEMFEAGADVDYFAWREQMMIAADGKRPGLLQGWTDADDARAKALYADAKRILKPSQIVDVAQRLADYIGGLEYVERAEDDTKAVKAGTLTPAAAILNAERLVREHCPTRKTWQIGNAGERVLSVFRERPKLRIPTRFDVLDSIMGGGLCYGNNYVCGKSGHGKTFLKIALALGLISPNTTKRDHRNNVHERLKIDMSPTRPHVLFISAEMSWQEITLRMSASALRISNNLLAKLDDKVTYQKVIDELNTRADGVTPDMFGKRLVEYGRFTVIDEEDIGFASPAAVVEAFAYWAATTREQDPEGTLVCFVDYLQHLENMNSDNDKERYREISLAAKDIDRVAKRYKVAAVVGLQLKPTPNGGNDEPTGASIAGATEVVNVAKNTLMIHSWKPSQRANLRAANQAEDVVQAMMVWNEKVRGSDGGLAMLAFDGEYSTITDADNPAANPLRDSKIVALSWAREPSEKPGRARGGRSKSPDADAPKADNIRPAQSGGTRYDDMSDDE